METTETNNTSTSKETATSNDEDTNIQPTTSSSTSPKRYKLDINEPSTSNQNECSVNHSSGADERNTTDADDDDKTQNKTDDTNNKEVFGRFSKRNYRRRTESESSTSSVSMTNETPQEQNNDDDDDGINSNQNDREESPQYLFPNYDEFMLDDSSDSYVSEQDDSPVSPTSSDTDSDDSTDNEEAIQTLLNKPKPTCELHMVRNLLYRQNGILFKNERPVRNAPATVLPQHIYGSVYSVQQMKLLLNLNHEPHGHHGCVNCLNFNKAGNLLVTGSDDLRVIVWNWAKCQPIVIQKCGHRSNIFQSKFVDNGSANNQTDFHLITSARDGEVRQIQVTPDGSAKERLITRHGNYAVHKIAIPDSNPNEVLTAGEDGCVLRSDLRDNKSSERLVQLRDEDNDKITLFSIAHHPFDPEFCICGRDKYVRVYDKRNVKECSKMFCPAFVKKQPKSTMYMNITCALYNYDGSEILASYADENIYLFDTAVSAPGAFKNYYTGHKNRQTIKGVNFFGPCSEFIMSGSDCGNFFMWHKENAAIVQWQHGDASGVVNCLEGHPHLPIIGTSGLDHDIKIWSPKWNPNQPDGYPSRTDLEKCVAANLKCPQYMMRSYMQNIARLVNPANFHRTELSSSDSSDSDSDNDEDLRTLYRSEGGPCDVQ